MSAIVRCNRCGASRDNDGPHQCHPADIADYADERIETLEAELSQAKAAIQRLERFAYRIYPLECSLLGIEDPDESR